MEEKILGALISGFTKELIKEGKNIFGTLNDETKQFLNTDIHNYLEKQKRKYSHVKTLLNGNTPVFLYNFYVHLRIENSDDDSEQETKKVSEIFESSNYITLIGDAGSGKSTLTKHLFLNSIFENFAIPILIELRYLNDYDGNLENFIEEMIFENKISQNHQILERLLEKGKFIFFLDGFDELNSEVRDNVIKRINSYLNKYGNNKYILTSRPYSNIEHLPLFKNYEICQLNDEEIELFIRLQLKSEEELAQKIIDSINDNKNLTFIQSFLTNPLLLSLYILTFQSNASIPAKKYI